MDATNAYFARTLRTVQGDPGGNIWPTREVGSGVTTGWWPLLVAAAQRLGFDGGHPFTGLRLRYGRPFTDMRPPLTGSAPPARQASQPATDVPDPRHPSDQALALGHGSGTAPTASRLRVWSKEMQRFPFRYIACALEIPR
jgi:hypothetical protein